MTARTRQWSTDRSPARTRPAVTRRPALALVAVAGALTLVTAGCTSSGSSGATGASSTAGSGTTAAAGGSGSGGSSPSPTTIINQPVARKAVTSKGCKQTSSGWTADGTVTNPNAKQTTYTIVISFTTKASTVLARGTTKVTLKSGATKNWSASANFAKTKGVVCVLRGVAAS